MAIPMNLHPDRLFPADAATRDLSRRLYASVSDLPIVSPHGHTDPQWFADDAPFANASALLITPDHYVFRMLYSQGLKLEDLGIPRRTDANEGRRAEQDPRKIWHAFASHYHLFRGTPTRIWLDHAFNTVFGIDERLTVESADRYFDRINGCLAQPAFRPRALFERFNIEVIATTESPLDPLVHHQKIRASGWKGRVVTAYRPDPVVDPEFEGFASNVAQFGALTGENTATWNGYLAAHRSRRAFFKTQGATSTDHGHPTARTSDLAPAECQRLLDRALAGVISADEAETFRGQVLTEMASDERGRRSRDADPSGQLPQSQSARLSRVWPRQGRGHSDAHRLRPCAEAAARSIGQRAQPDASSCSRSTRRAIHASWRLSRATIRF